MKSWCGLVGFAMLSSLIVKAQDAALVSVVPTKLKFYAGGHLGPSEWVELQDQGTVTYRHSILGDRIDADEKIPVDAAKWQAFRTALDQAKVWDWNDLRSDPPIIDGSQWELIVEYADRRISVTGDSAWPDREQFKQMNAGLKALTGINFGGPRLNLEMFGYRPGCRKVAIQGDSDTTRAPHGLGNVYAPEIMNRRARLMMWFGGQGQDGHDRIHLATSTDGLKWEQRGVVLEDPTANHVNDPSVVEKDGTLHLFYTRAGAGITDEIALATSPDGEHWETRGVVFSHGPEGAWDSLAVGRPSVMYSDGLFRMWYDGRKDLPLGAPDDTAPKSADSHRFVGYATSPDGIHWERRSKPVLGHDAGGVHVCRFKDHLAMVIESRDGTLACTSADGITWGKPGIIAKRLEKQPVSEDFGHVTPFLLPDSLGNGATLFYGAASKKAWDGNAICLLRLGGEAQEILLNFDSKD